MTHPLASKARDATAEIRRKPYPLADLIPLLQQLADELDSLYAELSYVQADILAKPPVTPGDSPKRRRDD